MMFLFSVSDGIVTLAGTVRSWSEYDAAEKNAYQAGAKSVENELTVSKDYQGPAGPAYYGGYAGPYGFELHGYSYGIGQ